MINWSQTTNLLNLTPETISTRKQVYVTCERCGKTRLQFYNVAGRKEQHICMSCRKTGKIDYPEINLKKTKELGTGKIQVGKKVVAICQTCKAEIIIKFTRSRFPNFRCGSCKIKEKWFKGEYQPKVHIFSDRERMLIGAKARDNWRSEEYREKWSKTRLGTREKRSAISKELWKRPDFQAKMRVNDSYQQQVLFSLLSDLGIKFYKEGQPECFYGPWPFDCRIDPQPGINLEKTLLIEVQGNYFHSKPEKISRDKAKATYIKRYHPEVQVKYIWEHEFNAAGRVRSLLEYWLGKSQPVIDVKFDLITLDRIEAKVAELFVSKYHYSGKIGRSGINLGFYYMGELCGLAIFCYPVRQEIATKQGLAYKDVLELSRFCIHPKYQVKNLASNLIARAIKYIRTQQPQIKLLVSFADSTYNHTGVIYKASNWKLDGMVASDYWYKDSDGYVCHKKTLWNHAKKMSMTESQYCEKYGFTKILGKEKYRYVFVITS